MIPMIEVISQQAWLGLPWKKRLFIVKPVFIGDLEGFYEPLLIVDDSGCTTDCRCRDEANRSRPYALKRYHNQILIKLPNVKHLRVQIYNEAT